MYEMILQMLFELQPWTRPTSVQHNSVKVAWQQEENFLGSN